MSNINNRITGTFNQIAQFNAATGEVTGLNATALSNVTLGNVSNLHIPGGANRDVLTTDGNSNLSWTAPNASFTSNVQTGQATSSVLGQTNSAQIDYHRVQANAITTGTTFQDTNLTQSGTGNSATTTIILSGNVVNTFANGDVVAIQGALANTYTINGVVYLPAPTNNTVLNLTTSAVKPSGNVFKFLTGLPNGNTVVTKTVYGNALSTSWDSVNNVLTVNAGNSLVANVANVNILGGTNGQVLTTDGSGNLSWSVAGVAGAGGNTTEIQYNDNGVLNGTSLFTIDAATGNVVLAGQLDLVEYNNAGGQYTTLRAYGSRGTQDAPSPVQVGDDLLAFNAGAYTGNGALTVDGSTGWVNARTLVSNVAVQPSQAGFRPASNTYLQSVTTANTTNQLVIDHTGTFTLSANGSTGGNFVVTNPTANTTGFTVLSTNSSNGIQIANNTTIGSGSQTQLTISAGANLNTSVRFTTSANGAFYWVTSAAGAVPFVTIPYSTATPSHVWDGATGVPMTFSRVSNFRIFNAQGSTTADPSSNGFDLIPAATGGTPQFTAFGSDANIGINYNSKGTSTHAFNNPVRVPRGTAQDSFADQWVTIGGNTAGSNTTPVVFGINSNTATFSGTRYSKAGVERWFLGTDSSSANGNFVLNSPAGVQSMNVNGATGTIAQTKGYALYNHTAITNFPNNFDQQFNGWVSQTDNTGLTWNNAGVWTNNTGRTLQVMVCIQSAWQANAVGARSHYIIQGSATSTRIGAVATDATTTASIATVQNSSVMIQMTAGDTFAIYGYQNSGGQLGYGGAYGGMPSGQSSRLTITVM